MNSNGRSIEKLSCVLKIPTSEHRHPFRSTEKIETIKEINWHDITGIGRGCSEARPIKSSFFAATSTKPYGSPDRINSRNFKSSPSDLHNSSRASNRGREALATSSADVCLLRSSPLLRRCSDGRTDVSSIIPVFTQLLLFYCLVMSSPLIKPNARTLHLSARVSEG